MKKYITFKVWITSLVLFIIFCGFIIPYLDSISTIPIRSYDFLKNVIVFDQVDLYTLEHLYGTTEIPWITHFILDGLWPIIYCSLFYTSLYLAYKNTQLPYISYLLYLPCIILILDFIQSLVTTLYIQGLIQPSIVQMIPFIATSRWMLIYTNAAFIIVGVYYVVRSIKSNTLEHHE